METLNAAQMNAQILQTLEKFLANTCTPEEIKLVSEILQQGAYLEEWEYILKVSQISLNDKTPSIQYTPNFQKLFDRIKSKIST